jgi:PIN domain nuclease of toxin-antitoxin system
LIVLDTHAWIWWATESRKLPVRMRRRIDRAPTIGVSAISCWEIAMLEAKARIRFDRTVLGWIEQALATEKLELLPIDPPVAVLAAQLPHFGGDPADHIIVATAKLQSAPLISADTRIAASKLVHVLWE